MIPPEAAKKWEKTSRIGKYGGPRQRRGIPPRQQYGMSAKDVAKLLDEPPIAQARKPVEIDAYRRYASGNDKIWELAEEFTNGNEFAFTVYVLWIEKNILRDASGLNLIPVPQHYPVLDPDPESVDAAEAKIVADHINQVADSKLPGEGIGGIKIFKAPKNPV